MTPAKTKSLNDLFKQDKQWLIDYMSNNPGANQIDNYIISINMLRANFSCAYEQECHLISDSSADPECEELRLFLLCFSCDRIFHQKCSNTSEEDLVNEKTPWICPQCIGNPLNSFAVEFFKSNRYNLPLKERLLKYATEVDISSPIKRPEDTTESLDDIEDDSLYDIPTIEKSLHVDFQNMELIDVSKILGTKLVHQQKEFLELKESFIATEKERLKLKGELAKKSDENETYMRKLLKLEQSMNERLFLQDTKLKNLEGSHKMPIGRQSPPSLVPLSSTIVSSNAKNSNFNVTQVMEGCSSSASQNNSSSTEKLKDVAFSIKVMKANDIKEQIARELNQMPSNISENRNFVSTSNYNISSFHSNHQSVVESVTMEHVNRLNLNEIRKNLPKIEQFDGNIDKWLTFERAVLRNRREGQYSDELTKYHIRQALTGQALARVDDLFDISSADEIMSFLKQCYGCSNNIVANARKKLLAVKLSRPLNHQSAMEVTTKIASYMAACKYAHLPVLDMSISLHIHSQLEPMIQQQYYNFYFMRYPGETRMERLDVQFEFINDVAKTLPMGEIKVAEKKDSSIKNSNYQVFSASVAVGDDDNRFLNPLKSVRIKNKDDFKYEIRSRDNAPYIGYNMEKVNSINKNCVFCDHSNHYPIECHKYREMPMDQRYNAVKSKGICSNCLLTTEHQTKDCDVKIGCGFNVDNFNKCAQKHHISLHRGKSIKSNNPYKRQNRNENTFDSQPKTNEAIQPEVNPASTPVATTSSQPQAAQIQNVSLNNKYAGYPIQSAAISSISQFHRNGYQMCSHTMHESSQRTVKLFRTFFYGNERKAIGYSVGDSASEVTLIKQDLIADLGISGEPCHIKLQWTDSSIKISPAIKVNLKISGILPDNEVLELNECYAIADLNLQSRSLNVENLKLQFPYLRDVPFESYQDAIPCMLLGSRHAHMFEAVEATIQNGNCKPVAIKTKLGYTIYGGAPEFNQNSYSIISASIHSDQNKPVNALNQKLLDCNNVSGGLIQELETNSKLKNERETSRNEVAFKLYKYKKKSSPKKKVKSDSKIILRRIRRANHKLLDLAILAIEIIMRSDNFPVVPRKNAIHDILLSYCKSKMIQSKPKLTSKGDKAESKERKILWGNMCSKIKLRKLDEMFQDKRKKKRKVKTSQEVTKPGSQINF